MKDFLSLIQILVVLNPLENYWERVKIVLSDK